MDFLYLCPPIVFKGNNRLHTINKKHVCKEKKKKTTHVEIGEKDRHHHIYISKISTMYVNMVTRLVYKMKKLKKAHVTARR